MDAITPAEIVNSLPAVSSAVSNLAAAICAISSKMETVCKLGVNDFHRYTYARMPDLMRVLAPLMAHHGVTMLRSEVGHELIAEGVLRVEFEFTIVHAFSGESRVIRSSGRAKVTGDRGGFNDRAIQAIATTTRKYVLIGLFGVVVDDLPDVDRGDHERPQARRKSTQPKQEAAPVFNRLSHELEAITSIGDLQVWGDENGVTIATFPADWQKALRYRYSEKLAELRPAKTDRTVRTVAPAPKHSLKPSGIAERAMTARYAQGFQRPAGPPQPFVATYDGPRRLPLLNVDMNDELPGDLGPPKSTRHVPTDDDGLGIPPMLDRRKGSKAGGAARTQGGEPSEWTALTEGGP
jgi:hypothetical protein